MLKRAMKQAIVGSCAAGVLGLTGASAHAAFLDEVYYSDFSEESVGAIPDGWDVERDDNGTWAVSGDEEYVFAEDDPGSAVAFGLSTFNGTLDNGASPSSLTDYRITATVRVPHPGDYEDGPLPGGAAGLTGRFTDDDNYYHLRLDSFSSTVGDYSLQLYAVTGGSFNLLDSVDIDVDQGVLELIMDGATITGKLYDYDTGDELHMLEVNDTTHAAGTFGLRAAVLDSSLYTEDLTVAIPEPGSLALLGAGGALMLIRRRR